MDPITAAVLAVLPAIASDVAKDAVRDAYAALKAVIRRKWGDAAPLARAIDAIEADPDSKALAAVLEEKVAETSADRDKEVIEALQTLLKRMQAEGVASEAAARISVTVSGSGNQGVFGAQNVRVDKMNFGGSSGG